jgi:hypothetical protein
MQWQSSGALTGEPIGLYKSGLDRTEGYVERFQQCSLAPFFFGFHKPGLEAIQATKQTEPALWKAR